MRKTGKNLLSDPLFNKGLGFPRTERDRLGIRGLVPPSTYVIKISTRNFENISFKSKYDSFASAVTAPAAVKTLRQ